MATTKQRAARKRSGQGLQAPTPEQVGQMQAGEIERAFAGEQQKTATALTSLNRANRDLAIFEDECGRQRALIVQQAADIDSADEDFADVVKILTEQLAPADEHAEDLPERMQALLDRLLEPETPEEPEEVAEPDDAEADSDATVTPIKRAPRKATGARKSTRKRTKR